MDSKTDLLPMEGTLTFTEGGDWVHDGEQVTHRGIADYFSSHLRYSDSHRSWIVEDRGRAVQVTVEDTPVVIRTITAGDDGEWTVLLSGGDSERFEYDALSVTADGRWYSLVRGRRVRARLLRAAVQHLLAHVEERKGRYFLHLKGAEFPIRHEGSGC